MHSERLPAVRSVLDDGASVGKIRRIVSHHCFRAPRNSSPATFACTAGSSHLARWEILVGTAFAPSCGP